jgi:endonuclease YncB( thermonuclease family)
MLLGLGLFSMLAAAGALTINWLGPTVEPAAMTLEGADARPTLIRAGASTEFSICGSVRRTCVVDGDTFWMDGVKIRIADIDTPEIGQPQCDREYQLGMKATYRLVELLNAGPFELRTIGGRDEDRFGRKLRVVIRSGRSLGDQLVSEGLARTWSGRREPWC